MSAKTKLPVLPRMAIPCSGDTKIGAVSATYFPTTWCAKTCPIASECYARQGRVGLHAGKIARAYPDESAAVREEARAIREDLPRATPLRLHVSGDTRRGWDAAILASACRSRIGPTWTYTHFWRRVARRTWRGVSTLASMESPADAPAAREQGYAPALVVARYPAGSRPWQAHGTTWIPCPATLPDSKRQCTDCKLCWKADALFDKGLGIAFEAHSGKARALKARLDGSK